MGLIGPGPNTQSESIVCLGMNKMAAEDQSLASSDQGGRMEECSETEELSLDTSDVVSFSRVGISWEADRSW